MKQNAVVRGLVVALTALVAGFGLIALAPVANAYNLPNCVVSASSQTVVSEGHFDATVQSDADAALSLTFIDQSASGAGKSLVHTFTAPKVTKPTKFAINATCTTSTTAGTAGQALKIVDQTVSAAPAFITVVPAGSGSVLPNAGGPSIWWLILGLLALLGGGGLIATSRRRQTDALAI